MEPVDLSLAGVCRTYGLPMKVAENYAKRKVDTLYQWQLDLIVRGRLLLPEAPSAVYCAPTSGGKTLVAELACLMQVMRGFQAIFIVPFISVVKEKEQNFLQYAAQVRVPARQAGRGFGGQAKTRAIKVKSCYGDVNAISVLKTDIIICTIDKATTIVNTFMKMGRARRIGCVVMDEMHLLGDPGRGPGLEMLVTRLLFFVRKCHEHGAPARTQLIGMSATVGNVHEVADWVTLGGFLGQRKAFVSSYRPVELQEHLLCRNKVYDVRTTEEGGRPDVEKMCIWQGEHSSSPLFLLSPRCH